MTKPSVLMCVGAWLVGCWLQEGGCLVGRKVGGGGGGEVEEVREWN